LVLTGKTHKAIATMIGISAKTNVTEPAGSVTLVFYSSLYPIGLTFPVIDAYAQLSETASGQVLRIFVSRSLRGGRAHWPS